MDRIILIEDDQSLGYILKEYLQLNNYDITWRQSAQEGYEAISTALFDLIIIDVNLPDYDGFELAERLNSSGNQIPFLFLTARRLKVDKLKGFKLGGEDFIIKPIDEEELLARIAVVLRRPSNNDPTKHSYRIGDVDFDLDSLQLIHSHQTIRLTEMEAELLSILYQHKNHLVSKKTIMLRVWKEDNYFTRRSMDVFISRLRKLLLIDPSIGIKTIHGKGYILTVPR